MADISQVVTSARDSVGRYFSLVSALPSALLVVWAALLVHSGAWNGQPDLGSALNGLTESGLGGAAGLLLATLVVGVVLHPMQFAFVQFIEGYWGVSRLASGLRTARVSTHWARLLTLRSAAARISARIMVLSTRRDDAGRRGDVATYELLDATVVRLNLAEREMRRVTAQFPVSSTDVMPTRLGNVLRFYEGAVGKAYGLDAVTTVPFLSRSAKDGDMAYVNDQRSQLDLAVRVTVVCLAAAALTTLFMARHGLWLLVALVPYAAAYLSYRGAVVAAGSYGRALGVLITLNRAELYERLHLEPVADVSAERNRNIELMKFLRHDAATADLTYKE